MDSIVADDFPFGTMQDMVMALGNPANDWTPDQRYIAAGHILTEWQDNPSLNGMYEMMRHASGSTDERTVHDLAPEDVFAICEELWKGVQDGRFVDPRHLAAQTVYVRGDGIEQARIDRFNDIVSSLTARLIDAELVLPVADGAPAAKPELWVWAFGISGNAANFLDGVHPEDAAILRLAQGVFMRLFDFTCTLEEGNSEWPGASEG
jgi:hypothetical protein